MSDLNCSEYSEKAIVVRGESTKTYKDNLKTLGGKYNASLKGGAGWIFSKTSEAKVNKFISSVNKGDITPSSPVEERQESRKATTSSVDIRMPSILQDIKTLMEGKDSEYKLAFLSSVTLLLTQNSVPVARPTPSLKPVLRQQHKAEVVTSSGCEEEEEQPAHTKPSLKAVLRQQPKAEVVISSDCEEEEEQPPRRRLLR